MYETTTKAKRNQFIVSHIVGGASLKEVKQLLIDGGFGVLSENRIWKIWKRSDKYQPKKAYERRCNLCSEVKPTSEVYRVLKSREVIGIVCKSCWDTHVLHLPENFTPTGPVTPESHEPQHPQ